MNKHLEKLRVLLGGTPRDTQIKKLVSERAQPVDAATVARLGLLTLAGVENSVRPDQTTLVDVDNSLLDVSTLGGSGSGNFGHGGRPGEIGGSTPVAGPDPAVENGSFGGVRKDRPAPFFSEMFQIDRQVPLSVEKRAKLFDAFSMIDNLLHDKEIGPQLWGTLSAFTPESLHDRVEAMRTNFHNEEFHSGIDTPVKMFMREAAATATVSAALTKILRVMADPEIGPDVERAVAATLSGPRAAVRAGILELLALEQRLLGGPGSGNFGHDGRPGTVGGSSSDGSGSSDGSSTGSWKDPGGFEHTGITWTQPTDAAGRPIPIKCQDVAQAASLVLEGKVVEVPDSRTAFTLVNKLADMAAEAKAAGKTAKEYDLCQVSVAGTNMFCADSLRTKEYPQGVPRLEMPQLGGKPEPGSEADKLPRNPWDKSEVDGSSQFITHLQGIGIKTSSDIVPAASLRASQRELIGSKVAGIAADRTFDPGKNPIFISNDNYVVDGHHRWAAVVLRDAEDGHLGDAKINVTRVNAPISEVLHLANAWSQHFGIKQAAGVTAQAKATGIHA